MNKYEQLIEYIINDNEKAARELFHQIVVAKSRDIYESLMDEELGGNQAQGFVSDIQDGVEQDQQGLGEEEEEFGMGGDDDMGDEFGDDDMGDEFGDDSMDGDDMDGGDEFGGDDMGDEFGGEEEGSVEDRVMDLEDELDALKAEFEQLLDGGSGAGDMSGDDMGSDDMDDMDGDDEMGGDDMGGDDMGGDDMDDEFGGDDTEEAGMMEASGKSGSGNPFAKKGSGSGKSGSGKSGSGKSGSGKAGSGNPFAKKGSGSGKMESRSQAEIMKEYVDKVKDMYKGEQGEGHEVGTGGSVTVNKTSITDNMKNDMGGTTANIVKGGAEADPKGTPPNKTGGVLKQGGVLKGAERNVNQVGGNKGAQNFFNTKETSWEKAKGKEGQTTDGSVSVDKHSLLKARK